MKTEIHQSLFDISPLEWDKLNQDENPFTSYAFLSALEKSDCIGSNTGWIPRYLIIRDDNDHALGAIPMYEKHHSWGEYVFDWAWANAWQQCGLEYYPKLIIAVPFSPVRGSRFLIAENQQRQQITIALLQAAIRHAEDNGCSSIHCLFPTNDEVNTLQTEKLLIRHDVQFHWQNFCYNCFGDFLATMNSRKRKKISRERRRVAEMGVEFRILNGSEIDRVTMLNMYRFYMSTIMAHGSSAYLNQDFFLMLAENMADKIVLVEAIFEDKVIAAALNIRHQDVLYGRYWGCDEEFNSLHFETCYYQAIDYCIEHKLNYFEGGAQGEHKLSRGFKPVITSSAHWLADNRLHSAVSDFLHHEKEHVARYQEMLNEHSPYRKCSKPG